MNNYTKKIRIRLILLLLGAVMISAPGFAQTRLIDNPIKSFSLLDEPQKDKKDKKRKDEFKVFAGVSLNNLRFDADQYETTTGVGWLLGGSYKRGKFLYWEVGGRYNKGVFNLKNANNPLDSSKYFDRIFGVSNIDVPLTFGINFLSFISRIAGLRVYVSAVPTFVLGVNKNDLGISKGDLNSFIFYGQGGVGVDVAFIFLEAGINYGFNKLLKDIDPSNPVQGFVNLGFRF